MPRDSTESQNNPQTRNPSITQPLPSSDSSFSNELDSDSDFQVQAHHRKKINKQNRKAKYDNKIKPLSSGIVKANSTQSTTKKVQSATVTEDTHKRLEAAKPDVRRLYVGGVASSNSSADISGHMIAAGIKKVVDVKQLSDHGGRKSFCVSVPQDMFSTASDIKLWPSNIIIRPFRDERPGSRSQQKSSSRQIKKQSYRHTTTTSQGNRIKQKPREQYPRKHQQCEGHWQSDSWSQEPRSSRYQDETYRTWPEDTHREDWDEYRHSGWYPTYRRW